MKCPICTEHELVTQSLEDTHGQTPDIFCPQIVKLPSGKIYNHYRVNHNNTGQPLITRIIALPYRIITKHDKSQISMLSKYRSGAPYFKTMMTIPAVHADKEKRLLDRIKLLILLS
jgi:hypothetical protein